MVVWRGRSETGEYVDFVINSVLFQGTPEEISVKFDGYKFATKIQINNHYVMKRKFDEGLTIALVQLLGSYLMKNNKIQIKIDEGPNVEAILNMIGINYWWWNFSNSRFGTNTR